MHLVWDLQAFWQDMQWFQGYWRISWQAFSIAVKELYPIVLALILWSHVLADKRLLVLCDDEAVVHVINNQTCKEQNIMSLIRTMTVTMMWNNVILRTKHVPGKKNIITDALSRFQDTPEIRNQYGLVLKRAMLHHPSPVLYLQSHLIRCTI